MKKIIILVSLVLGVFAFAYYGKDSENEFIRTKAQGILQDKIVVKIIDGYEKVSVESKEYALYRSLRKNQDDNVTEQNLIKEYIAYKTFSEKAREMGLDVSPEEMGIISEQVTKFAGEVNTANLIMKGKSVDIKNKDELISSIKEIEINQELAEKVEKHLKDNYNGEDFAGYLNQIKEELYQVWQAESRD